MKTLTVFTPTYNRAYCLHKCYESLKRQTSPDFTWLIIDDGSSDGTKALVAQWEKEGALDISYHYQANQGMHGAHNTAYKLIQTELNVCIDSDDYMPDDAVEKIVSFWRKHGHDQAAGLAGLDCYPNGELIGTKLPEHIDSSTLYDLYHKHGVTGDKKLVYRTELTKQYPYPLFEGERYVGLAYKYFMLDQHYELLLLNEPLCCVEYLADGSSMNMLWQYRNNPRGFAFYRKELIKLPFASVAFKLRHGIHYVSSSLLARNLQLWKEAPQKSPIVMGLLPGFLLFLFIRWKTRKTIG